MHRLGLWTVCGALALAAGCSDDDSSATTGAETGASSADGSGTGSASADDTGGTAATSNDDTPGTSAATGDDSGTAGTDGTTGGLVEYCNGWDEEADAPFLDVFDAGGTALASGGTLPIACGGQGSWMFPIYPHMGGWNPATGSITFVVEVQVEGFPGPTGAFFSAPGYPYDIECFQGGDEFDDGIGGFSHDCIAVLPPDDYLDDLSVLDGAAATVHVEMLDDAGTSVSTVDLVDMTISAPMRTVSNECFF